MKVEKYTVVRVIKKDGTCEQFFQYPFEHMVMLGADNEVCFTSGDRKIIIDLNEVAYIKIKQHEFN